MCPSAKGGERQREGESERERERERERGQPAIGEEPTSALRPAFGRPEGRFGSLPGSRLAKIRPGRPIYGPEAVLHDSCSLAPSPQG